MSDELRDRIILHTARTVAFMAAIVIAKLTEPLTNANVALVQDTAELNRLVRELEDEEKARLKRDPWARMASDE